MLTYRNTENSEMVEIPKKQQELFMLPLQMMASISYLSRWNEFPVSLSVYYQQFKEGRAVS